MSRIDLSSLIDAIETHFGSYCTEVTLGVSNDTYYVYGFSNKVLNECKKLLADYDNIEYVKSGKPRVLINE